MIISAYLLDPAPIGVGAPTFRFGHLFVSVIE